ncbi:MAG: DUF1223 domain-containing protein, partial [Alphaproteobacteria bacterium]|nr:DUF1223 domain-containing protein [Alphaproteobacteria bacterium]
GLAASSPVVVELFTSQGCNSCPPADAYLAELARQPQVLALAYHIDYWDQLGWRDPFSSPAATARQRAYAETLGLRTIYTPQMVINGRIDAVGSDRTQIAAALAASGALAVPVTLETDRDALAIQLGAGTGHGRIWLVDYDLEHETHVRGGENRGRTLVNVNIVRAIAELGPWTGAPAAFRRARPGSGGGSAVLLQSDSGAILGAASVTA